MQSIRDEQLAYCDITTLDTSKQKVALCYHLSWKFKIIRLLAFSLPMILRSHNYFQFLGMCWEGSQACLLNSNIFANELQPPKHREHTERPRAQKSPNKGFSATALCMVSHCGEVLFLMWEDMNNGLFQLVSFHR